MNPGKLNKKIKIWGKKPGVNELGQNTLEDEYLKDVWAQIIPQTGRLMNQPAETILSNVTHKIIIRHQAFPGLKDSMFITYKGKRFDIDFVLNPYEKNEYLEVFARQVGS